MDMETLQLMLEAGPNAVSLGTTYIIAEALSGLTLFIIAFGSINYVVNKWASSYLFDELTEEQQQEVLQRKFKLGKANEKKQSDDV